MTSRAIVLAAGRGARLAPLTDDMPKPLLSVARRPVLVHILDGISRSGICDVAIVTGYRGDMIEHEIGNGSAAGMSIEYFRQESLTGTASALALAREWASGEPFLYSWGDILVLPESYQRVVRSSRLTGAALAINRVDDPAHGAAVYVDDESGDGFVQRIVEKPPPGESTTCWNASGIGVLPPAVWPLVDALEPSPRGEYELPAAIGALIASGTSVRAVPIEGHWFDIGTAESLDAARAAFEGLA